MQSISFRKRVTLVPLCRFGKLYRHFSTDAIDIPKIGLFQKASEKLRWNKPAIIAPSYVEQRGPSQAFTYGHLLRDADLISNQILRLSGQSVDLKEARVALLAANGYNYVRSQWGIWKAGGIFVPLCPTHPPAEIEYVLKDSESSVALCDKAHEAILRPLAEKNKIALHVLDDPQASKVIAASEVHTRDFDSSRGAMIVYTSGTTGRPKVTTHRNLESQVLSMIGPWGWNEKDHILHVLPLHHVHGIVNVLTCPLWAGAVCEMMTKFDAKLVWQRIIDGKGLTLFMAVPTIYARLIQEYEQMNGEMQKKAREACGKLRLMVSGSAALPESVMNRWHQISGHVLLERYGMTEIGMALSNPLNGKRLGGFVGTPLPGVEVRILDESTGTIVTKEGEAGELRVKGPSVFKEYWKKPAATQDTFDSEGWFKTGDIATVIEGRYKILGRASVDIIKSGGYKISALDIERELLEHPDILECAVVGLEDEAMGQKIAVVLVQRNNGSPLLDAEQLKQWAKNRLAAYKIPRVVLQVQNIPKNAMGKINKKELIKLFK